MSHIIFKKDKVIEELVSEIPLIRLKKVGEHFETPEGSIVNCSPVPDGLFNIVLAKLSREEYWINSCTWCHEYEQRIVESKAGAYELEQGKDETHFLRIPIRLLYINPS